MYPFDGRIGKRIEKDLIAELRFFGFYIGNETLLLPDIKDMSIVYESPNALGELFMIQLFKKHKPDHTSKNIFQLNEVDYVKSLLQKKQYSLPIEKDQVMNDQNWRCALIRFMIDFGNRSLATEPLIGYDSDYFEEMIYEGNAIEMMTVIFCNILRMDRDENIINEDWVRYRTSQYIRTYVDDSYIAKPIFKEWETILWV